MKLWAKVRFNEKENAGILIEAFFEEFNSESSIAIRGKEAKIEIVFNNNPPMSTIRAIKQCEVEEFIFGKTLEEYCPEQLEEGLKAFEKADEPEVVQENVENINTPLATEENESNIESLKKKMGRPKGKKDENTRTREIKVINIPQFEEIAKNSTSFEHFVKLVAEWLEMKKKQEFFENLVLVASEVEEISWKTLEDGLEHKGIVCTQWDRIFIGKRLSEKLKEYSVTALTLLNSIKQYKNYQFTQPISKESSIENSTNKVQGDISKNRVKMEGMPEIPKFEEILGSINKSQPIEERIRYVLIAMGLEELASQEQQEIFEITNIAVRLREINFDIIFSKVSISNESVLKARLTFSKFINDFVSKYAPDNKVKLLDFLKQLQKVVVDDSEIQSFNNASF